ncbi:MAG: hypothetical protein AMXMBFR61_16720 [Fimbriimonadales bacterium]
MPFAIILAAILAQAPAVTAPAPTGLELRAVPYHTTVRLTWQETGAPCYALVRSTVGTTGSSPEVVRYSAKGDFTDYGLMPGVEYAYRVAPLDRTGLLSEAWSPEVRVRTGVSAQNLLRITTHDLLYVIYTGGMSQAEVDRLYNGVVRDGREFYWRNSRLRYNLNVVPMIIPTYPPDTSGPSMANIEADLRARGVQNNQYDGCYVTGNNLNGCYGGFVILGQTAAAYARVCGVPSQYEGMSDTDATVVWGFTHEFGHALDLVLCAWSGHPEMLFNHFPWAYPLPPGIHFDAGPHFDGMGEVLRIYNAYHDFQPPWDGYIEVVDADGDGVPDDDSRVPIDEARFGSSAASADTDGDGLSDFDEMCAGRYAGSNPNVQDTDGDALPDGQDPWPLVRMSPVLWQAATDPVMDGDADASYEWLSDGFVFSKDATLTMQVRACWRPDALYLHFTSNKSVRVWICLDGSAENGRWDSGGKFAENGSLYSDTAYGDSYIEDGVLIAEYGVPTVRKRGSAIAGSAVSYKQSGGQYLFEVKIPTGLGPGDSYSYFRQNDPLITGISLFSGKQLGFNFTVATRSSSSTSQYSGSWATSGEIYNSYDVMLMDRAATIRGVVAMQQCTNPEGHTALLEFRDPGTTRVRAVLPITLDDGAQYEAVGAPSGTFDLAVKFQHHLRRVSPSRTLVAGMNYVDFLQINGDADNNNSVDIGDLNAVLTRFGLADPVADLNCSGSVDLADLNIVLLNFGRVGDP